MEHECYVKISQADWERHHRYAYMKWNSNHLGMKDVNIKLVFVSFQPIYILAALMMRIEDVVIKTIIAGELHIASACKMFMPSPGNCFGK